MQRWAMGKLPNTAAPSASNPKAQYHIPTSPHSLFTHRQEERLFSLLLQIGFHNAVGVCSHWGTGQDRKQQKRCIFCTVCTIMLHYSSQAAFCSILKVAFTLTFPTKVCYHRAWLGMWGWEG